MAYSPIYDYNFSQADFQPDVEYKDAEAGRLLGEIRLCFFFIAGECVGLPALVWALRVLYGHRKSGGRTSVFIIMLLLNDLLELLLGLYIMVTLLTGLGCSTECQELFSLWFGSNLFGLHFHQVVALEGVLSLRQPLCSTCVVYPSCSVITSITAFFSFYFGTYFSSNIAVALGLPFIVVITLTSCIVTCRASPHTDNIPLRFTLLAISSFTMFLYVFVIINIFFLNYWALWLEVSLWSLRVILDPPLCVLVCRRILMVSTPQTQTDLKQV